MVIYLYQALVSLSNDEPWHGPRKIVLRQKTSLLRVQCGSIELFLLNISARSTCFSPACAISL